MSPSSSIFLLGATGYVGGQVLVSLAVEFPLLPIRALTRNLSCSKIAHLQSLHPKLEVVGGSLEDVDVIEVEAKKAGIVINVAAAGDMDSINAILRGLTQRGSSLPTSIYIHMSGTGLLGDAGNGELIAPKKIWVDTEFTGETLKGPDFQGNLLKSPCEAIVHASKASPSVRTMIILPGLIYGVGPGIQKVSLPQRVFLNLASQAGHMGTIGPGRNVLGYIHLKDVASAVSAVLSGALQGKNVGEGDNGFYFVVSKYMISLLDLCGIIGDVLWNQGLIPESKARPTPFSAQIVEKIGAFASIMSSSPFCRAERLTKELGWTAKHTELPEAGESLLESLPREIELGVKDFEASFKPLL